jgi:hypothetical protein
MRPEISNRMGESSNEMRLKARGAAAVGGTEPFHCPGGVISDVGWISRRFVFVRVCRDGSSRPSATKPSLSNLKCGGGWLLCGLRALAASPSHDGSRSSTGLQILVLESLGLPFCCESQIALRNAKAPLLLFETIMLGSGHNAAAWWRQPMSANRRHELAQRGWTCWRYSDPYLWHGS